MSHSNEIKALVHLLEDPDEFIFDQVKDKLMQLGPNVIPYLEKAWEKDDFGDLFQEKSKILALQKQSFSSARLQTLKNESKTKTMTFLTNSLSAVLPQGC